MRVTYKDYSFRSKIEVRWAVFFTMLGIPYEYEKERFIFNIGGKMVKYIPDFWLPEQNCWIEIKVPPPTEEEQKKAELLANLTVKDVYIFFGNIPSNQEIQTYLGYTDSSYKFFSDSRFGTQYWWCECKFCGLLGIELLGRAENLPCKPSCPNSNNPTNEKRFNYDSPRLWEAYRKARTVKFEF